MEPLPGIADISEPVRELIREAAVGVLNAPQEWLDELNDAMMRGTGMVRVVDDPVLTDLAFRTNMGNLALWAMSNLDEPGQRVPATVTEDTRVLVHELVRRGGDASFLDSFRTAQDLAWRRFMEICFSLTEDLPLLRELLEVSSMSIATFVDDSVRLMTEHVQLARQQLAGDTHTQRRAAVALILEGAPIPEERAREQLGYGLSGPQRAVVISGPAGISADRLETVADEIMAASGLPRRLTVLNGDTESWVWFPGHDLVVDDVVARHSEVRVAVGAPGDDREGFRRSHFQALTAHRLLTRPGASRRLAHYAEIRLLDAMSDDEAKRAEFVAATLGDLAQAPAELAECLHAWFAAQCNASVTAQRLYTHRNTVVRRLERARELLPVDLETDAIAVAAALEVLHWQR